MSDMEIKSIEFSNFTFKFDEDHQILKNCSFKMPMNTVVRVHGPHGCGKSTILKILAALVEPDHGDYLINGEAINEMSFEELIPYRLKVGYGFEYGGLLNNRTIRQNLMLPIEYHKAMTPGEAKDHVDHIIETFSLTRSAKYRPSAISGGQRKLSCIARAFVMNPEVLILDEPTHGLNEKSIETLCQYVSEKMEQKIIKHVFLTTESPQLIEGLVKKDVVIQEGTMIDFEEFYLGVAGEKVS